MRTTCKRWYNLSKDRRFAKKHIAQATTKESDFVAIMLLNCRVYLTNVNLNGILNNSDPLLKPRGKIISLYGSDEVGYTFRVFHCEGLLLCNTKDYTKLVVWNPYFGQTRWIYVEPRCADHEKIWYENALGYDKRKPTRAYKILRFAHFLLEEPEIYEFNTNLWRVLDVTPDWRILYNHHGVSLKGNTYWFASDKDSSDNVPDFLLEEQLAVLHQEWHGDLATHIWITTKIEPNTVSWSKFLEVNMQPRTGFFV
ncbi:putative F-box protein At3g17620 [Capsella rubella]|uniref:putative F-box protein At3g17620 n=1 Tax=Capsella rubella TaxID=81985 RepID=UPI000CD573C5|nr:putative F-box protein At3g17620 [Capsella rubella]